MEQDQDLHLNESGRDFLLSWAPCFSPVLCLPCMVSLYSGRHPFLVGVAVALGFALSLILVLLRMATRWVALLRRGDHIVLVTRMRVEALPSWITGLGTAPRAAGGGLEVPMEGASVEWVGSRLLLHSTAGMYLLGSGGKAKTIAAWLEAQGIR
jgi:hypothetical protein